MSTLKNIAKGVGIATGGIIGIALLVLVIVALGSIIGGLVGAGIAIAYNAILGTTFSISKFALIGSIVGVVGGGASANSGDA